LGIKSLKPWNHNRLRNVLHSGNNKPDEKWPWIFFRAGDAHALWSHKLRFVLLTMFGIAWGVGLAFVSGGPWGKGSDRASIRTWRTSVRTSSFIWSGQGAGRRRTAPGDAAATYLTHQDYLDIKKEAHAGKKTLPPLLNRGDIRAVSDFCHGQRVGDGQHSQTTTRYGFFAVRAEGRWLNQGDEDQRRKTWCVAWLPDDAQFCFPEGRLSQHLFF